jgi:hypothetical protein
MSRKNVELVRRAAEHFQRTGEPWWEMLDADIEIYDHDIPDAGEYRGPDGLPRVGRPLGRGLGEFLDRAGRVHSRRRQGCRGGSPVGPGKGSGVPLERIDGMVWTLRDGKAVRLDYFGIRTEAFEAAGLSE